MNKKLLTVAIGAALAVPAFMAQADVKVYGRLQVEEGRVSVEPNGSAYTPTSGSAVSNSGHEADRWVTNDTGLGRLGVAVDEDMGGGWKALGLIEMAIDTADGLATDASSTITSTGSSITGTQGQMFAAREVYVGVSHKDIGTFKFGRHNSPYLNAGVALDPFVTTMLEARGNLGMSSNKDGVLNGHSSFLNEGLVFNSNTWGGFAFQLYYGLDQSGTEATKAGAQGVTGNNNLTGTKTAGDLSVNVGWAGGPAKVFASYAKQNISVVTGATPTQLNDATSYQVGGSLTFGGTTLQLFYESADLGIESTTAVTGRTWLGGGVKQTIGSIDLVANIVKYNADAGAALEEEGQYYVVGGIYNMSKTARVFAGYRATNNKLSATDQVLRDERVTSIGLRKDF